MTARRIVREVTRYEIAAADLAQLIGIPKGRDIKDCTFHNGVLRIFTADLERVSAVLDETELQSDDKGRP